MAMKMSRNRFWKIVAEIGWGTKTTNVREVELSLMKRGQAWCNALRAHFEAVDSELYKATEMGGWDSGDDCRRHIIGLGQDEFDAVMANPSLAQERYDRGDYTESFVYCIPHDNDFEAYRLPKLIEWAKRNIDEITEYQDGLEELGQTKIVQDQNALVAIHQAFIDSSDLDAFIAQERTIKRLAERIEKQHTALCEKIGTSYPGSKWPVLNLVSDAKKVRELIA